MRERISKFLEYIGLAEPIPPVFNVDDGHRPEPGPDSSYYVIKDVDHDFVLYYAEHLARIRHRRLVVIKCIIFFVLFVAAVLVLARTPTERAASKTHGPLYEMRLKSCEKLIKKQPGDLAFVLKHDWEISCAGDSEFSSKQSDVEDLGGYTDPNEWEIVLNVDCADELTIAHEAAHAIDIMSLDPAQKAVFAVKHGHAKWDDARLNYWTSPDESFADTRAACLGYEIYFDILPMQCGEVNDLINGSSDAAEIKRMAKMAE